MAATDKPNLYQRISAVTQEVSTVEATGHNQYQARAISIADVERALAPVLAKHGVVTRWGNPDLADIGNGKLWQATLCVTVINADAPDDHFTEQWRDIGGTPAAACSFAVKGFYRRIFHIAEDDEGAETPARTTAKAQTRDQPVTQPATSANGKGSNPERTKGLAAMGEAMKTLAQARGEDPRATLGAGGHFLGFSFAKTSELSDSQIASLTDWAKTQTTLLEKNSQTAEHELV